MRFRIIVYIDILYIKWKHRKTVFQRKVINKVGGQLTNWIMTFIDIKCLQPLFIYHCYLYRNVLYQIKKIVFHRKINSLGQLTDLSMVLLVRFSVLLFLWCTYIKWKHKTKIRRKVGNWNWRSLNWAFIVLCFYLIDNIQKRGLFFIFNLSLNYCCHMLSLKIQHIEINEEK